MFPICDNAPMIFLPASQTSNAKKPVAHKAMPKLPVYSLTVPRTSVSTTLAMLAIMFMNPAAVAR